MRKEDTKPRCGCGKYSGYMCDQGTPYGCADPEDPEPLDPYYYCKKCAKEEYSKLVNILKKLKIGESVPHYFWLKPNWFMKAISKSNCELRNEYNTNHRIVKL